MSDTLTNALAQSAHSQSVLAGIQNPATVNPLAGMGSAISAVSGMQGLAESAAKQRAGQAFLNSIDPATGQPNQSLLLQNLQRDPATAYYAQESAQKGLTLDTGTYDLHNKRVNGAMGAMGQLIADNPGGVPADALRAAIDQQHSLGNITDQEAQAARSQVSDNPRANTQFVIRGMGHGLSAQQALDAAKPSPSVQNIGGQIVTLQPSAQGASSPTPSLSQGTGGVGTTLTPGEATALDKIDIGNGQTIQVPHESTGALLRANPGWRAIAAPSASPTSSTTPPAPPANYVARPAPAAPAAPPAVPVVAPAPPTLGVSAPPGKVEAGQETGKQSATMGGALITRGDQAPVQKANLQNMMTDLAKLDSMGPGTDKEIFLNSVMQKLTGYGFSMNRDQVAAGNSFAKLANIAVGQQLAAIGGTDARQSLFMGSNPHLDMSKLGNERIIQMLMGNEDAIQAKSRAWTAWSQSHGDDTYRQFQDDFNRHFDPRVFQSQYMAKGGPELAALRASLEREGTAAIEKFKADTTYARDNRWIQ